MPEELLISELSKGSTKAFEELYGIYADKLFGYCLRYTKSRELSEELVQDTFVALWNSRENIRNSSSISGFIFKIAKNRLINIYRLRVASPIYEAYVEYQNHTQLATNDTLNMLEYDDFTKKIDTLITKLPKTQQNILKLNLYDGLSNRDISERLNIADQTVRNKLSLALKFLRENLTLFLPFFWVQFIIILSMYIYILR